VAVPSNLAKPSGYVKRPGIEQPPFKLAQTICAAVLAHSPGQKRNARRCGNWALDCCADHYRDTLDFWSRRRKRLAQGVDQYLLDMVLVTTSRTLIKRQRLTAGLFRSAFSERQKAEVDFFVAD